MNHLLDVKELKAYYKTPLGPVRAVDGVDLSVQKNEIIGIAGESGCGKTTLSKAVLRLLVPPGYIQGGEVLFKGTDLLSLDEEDLREIRGKHVSYIPQSAMNALNPIMRIKDQVMDAIIDHGGLHNEEKSEVEQRIKELFKMVGLSERWGNAYPHELSGGMKQRAVIVVGIALQPDLIIADEPTTALDVVVQRGIIDLLRQIKEKTGVALMVITHDMGVHAMMADRIAIMYAGKIVEISNTRDCFRDPLHPYAEVLISSLPTIGEKRNLEFLPGYPPSLLNPPSGCRLRPRCPKATKLCSKSEPILQKLENGRFVACHLYGQ